MSKPSWFVVVDPSGRVLGTGGGVPAAWARASTADDLDRDAAPVAEAMRAVARDVSGGAVRASRHVALAEAEVEVLALAAIALARRRADLADVVARALAPFFGQAAARDVLLRVENPEAERLEVDVDVAKLTWAIATLVGNALRFVRTGTRHAPGGTITVRLGRQGARVIVEVGDDGTGIEAADLARLFDPKAGAAIALLMARDVAAAHGGALRIESSTSPESHGTVIQLELPIPASDAP